MRKIPEAAFDSLNSRGFGLITRNLPSLRVIRKDLIQCWAAVSKGEDLHQAPPLPLR